MGSRWARLARGLSSAVFIVMVAAVSHGLAGGRAPAPFAILVSLVIASAICTLLAGGSLSFWRSATSVALSQFLFHSIFSSLGAPVAVAHTMRSMAPDAATLHLHGGATMWGAHAAAAVITLVALRYAETAFWGVADTARLFIARLLPTVAPVTATPAPQIPADRLGAVAPLAHILASMRRRGPPMGVFAA